MLWFYLYVACSVVAAFVCAPKLADEHMAYHNRQCDRSRTYTRDCGGKRELPNGEDKIVGLCRALVLAPFWPITLFCQIWLKVCRTPVERRVLAERRKREEAERLAEAQRVLGQMPAPPISAEKMRQLGWTIAEDGTAVLFEMSSDRPRQMDPAEARRRWADLLDGPEVDQ